MDFSKHLESLDIAIGDDIQKKVIQATKNIYSTIATNSDKTKTRMKLPVEEECEREILALAIERLLAQTFKIALSRKVMMKIKNGTSIKFRVKTQEELPAIKIVIILDTDKRQQLSVQGVAPEDGIDGYSDLIFHWQQEAGIIDTRGHIDLKKINKLPGVKEGSLLAQICQHTSGQPGINCFGKRLRQSTGKSLKVKWDEESVSRIDSSDDILDTASYELYAKKGGIVQFSLNQNDNPKTLEKISIQDTVVINGDVDYGVGDQGEIACPELGCESNIIVEGSVRGVFSIQSNGYIHVKNSIEGTVAANDVETAIITGGSFVTAKRNLIAGSIINATAKASIITVKENTNGSSLEAFEEVIFEENTTAMSLNVSTKKLQSKATKFSGVCSFILGEELFCSVENCTAELNKINKKINESSGPLKETAETIVDHLALLNSITRKESGKVEPEVIQILDKIKIALVAGFKSVEKSIEDSIVPDAYRLQTILGENKFDESVLRKVDLLIKTITLYNQRENAVAPLVKEMHLHESELSELHSQINSELVMQFANVELVSDNSELRIFCGEAEQFFKKNDIPGRNFSIQYHPPEEIENIRKGSFEIS